MNEYQMKDGRPPMQPLEILEFIMSEVYWRQTERDRFAMAALTGLIAKDWEEGVLFDELSDDAYKFADAMLKAREVKL